MDSNIIDISDDIYETFFPFSWVVRHINLGKWRMPIAVIPGNDVIYWDHDTASGIRGAFTKYGRHVAKIYKVAQLTRSRKWTLKDG